MLRTLLVVLGFLAVFPSMSLAQGEGLQTLHEDGVVLTFDARERLQLRMPSTGAALCAAPCALRIRPGDYEFAVRRPYQGDEQRGSVSIDGPGALRAEYLDRSGARAAGWTVLIVGLVASAVLAAAGGALVASSVTGTDLNGGALLLLGGAGAFSVGLGVGLPLVFSGDGVRFAFE